MEFIIIENLILIYLYEKNYNKIKNEKINFLITYYSNNK